MMFHVPGISRSHIMTEKGEATSMAIQLAAKWH